MTKKIYFDMHSQMGTDPFEGSVPVDFDELLYQSQDAFAVDQYLQDNWDTMNGKYLGKDFSGLDFVFNMLKIDKTNWQVIIYLLNKVISIRMEKLNK